jgi:hypothetical protein
LFFGDHELFFGDHELFFGDHELFFGDHEVFYVGAPCVLVARTRCGLKRGMLSSNRKARGHEPASCFVSPKLHGRDPLTFGMPSATFVVSPQVQSCGPRLSPGGSRLSPSISPLSPNGSKLLSGRRERCAGNGTCHSMGSGLLPDTSARASPPRLAVRAYRKRVLPSCRTRTATLSSDISALAAVRR